MAKAGTLNHPKTLHLAEELDVEPWGALGVLEALWGWAAEYAPQGDVGKHRDIVIADGLKWRSKPATLIAALVKAGWLDESADHRLVIHDWGDHLPEYVKKRLDRKGLVPVSGYGFGGQNGPNGGHAADTRTPRTPKKPPGGGHAADELGDMADGRTPDGGQNGPNGGHAADPPRAQNPSQPIQTHPVPTGGLVPTPREDGAKPGSAGGFDKSFAGTAPPGTGFEPDLDDSEAKRRLVQEQVATFKRQRELVAA